MITKGSYNKRNCSKNQLFFNSARHGFEVLLRNIFKSRSDIILMPGYIGESAKEGSGVFDPIRDTGVKYVFYKVNHDLTVNFEDLKQKLERPNVKGVLLIHWFGFPQKCIFELSELCKAKKIYLIEDCAHAISSTYKGVKLGCIGDFALYSIHKILTSDNGGILQANSKESFNIIVGESENIDKADLLQYARSDIEMIAQKKKHNYQLYLNNLEKKSKLFDILYPELEDGVVPNNFPIFIKNYDRFQLYNELMDIDIPTVVLYYKMINELDKDEFSTSYEIANTILNLPIHQDIEAEDVTRICDVLNNYDIKK